MRIGIDLMGSDNSPLELFKGVLQAAEELDPSCIFVVLATPDVVRQLKESHTARIVYHEADEVINMTDEPLSAVRRKKKATLVAGIQLLKKKNLDALVSAGNTGALITGAKVHLPMFPAIRRPALLAQLPTKKKMLSIIDAGGNIKNTPTSLIQYALMGIAYQQCCAGIELPVVGLLNIGSEPHKGTSLQQQTYLQLKSLHEKQKNFHFLGNIEARDLFDGQINVLVTDGFTGNVLLKTAEGTAAYILHSVAHHFSQSFSPESLQSDFNYAGYPGALVCGVDGVLIKCHGDASQKSIYSAIRGAIDIVNKKLISKMKDAFRP